MNALFHSHLIELITTVLKSKILITWLQLKRVFYIRCAYLLIFPFCLEQDLIVVVTFRNATFIAHGRPVVPAVVNQRLFMLVAQQHGPRTFTPSRERVPAAGAGAVGGLGQHAQGHVTLEGGPGLKLGAADGALRSYIRLALDVPVSADALLAEGVAARDGHRDAETLQAYSASQVGILRIHL